MENTTEETADQLKDRVIRTYEAMFGVTSEDVRLDDIFEEANELHMYIDIANMKEELSDLIASCFALAAEKNWTIAELVQMNLDKLEVRRVNGHYLYVK